MLNLPPTRAAGCTRQGWLALPQAVATLPCVVWGKLCSGGGWLCWGSDPALRSWRGRRMCCDLAQSPLATPQGWAGLGRAEVLARISVFYYSCYFFHKSSKSALWETPSDSIRSTEIGFSTFAPQDVAVPSTGSQCPSTDSDDPRLCSFGDLLGHFPPEQISLKPSALYFDLTFLFSKGKSEGLSGTKCFTLLPFCLSSHLFLCPDHFPNYFAAMLPTELLRVGQGNGGFWSQWGHNPHFQTAAFVSLGWTLDALPPQAGHVYVSNLGEFSQEGECLKTVKLL